MPIAPLSTQASPARSRRVPLPVTRRAFVCRCGRPVFFSNSECLACHTPLGYEPLRRLLLPLQSAAGLWCEAGAQPHADAEPSQVSSIPSPDEGQAAPRYRRCAHFETASACNWLVEESDPGELCRSCRLTRILPDLSLAENALWFQRIELAKRRLVSSLIGLGLPVAPKTDQDPELGLAFELLRAPPGALPVVTGHDDGVITLDIEEADDATREQRRGAMHEPYRTLLGHLRHETGHYYWQRLVDGSAWLDAYRELFGDERQDYAAALQRHYEVGAPIDWGASHVSAYASSHPWEDWAETWAHYLHMADTLDTARSFGLDGEGVELNYERYGPEVVGDSADPANSEFLALLNGWMELTGVLNELSRSMGVPDFYPFVLSVPAVRKLNFVHRVVAAGAR